MTKVAIYARVSPKFPDGGEPASGATGCRPTARLDRHRHLHRRGHLRRQGPGSTPRLRQAADGRGPAGLRYDRAWSVDRLGRSLSHLVAFLGDIQTKGVDLYLHQQGLDTSTSAGRAMFGMLGVFAELERSLIRERIMAGPRRSQKRSGRRPMPDSRVRAICRSLKEGMSIRATARLHRASPMTVTRIARSEA